MEILEDINGKRDGKNKFPDFGGFNISEGVTHLKPR